MGPSSPAAVPIFTGEPSIPSGRFPDFLTRPGRKQTGCCGGPALGEMAARKMGNHHALRVIAPTIGYHFPPDFFPKD